MRPEGPPVNRPGRQAGIRSLVTMEAPKARHFMMRFRLSAALSALIQSKSPTPALRPGLFTDGPSGLNRTKIYTLENRSDASSTPSVKCVPQSAKMGASSLSPERAQQNSPGWSAAEPWGIPSSAESPERAAQKLNQIPGYCMSLHSVSPLQGSRKMHAGTAEPCSVAPP